MRLFEFSYSPFAAKVRKCLELKGLRCQIIDVPYLDRRELIAVTGGSAAIPVLEDHGKVMEDSPVITAYLDEYYPPSLRAGAYGSLAAVIEQWAEGPMEELAFRLACPGLEAGFAAMQGGREDARALFRLIKERKYGTGCIEAWARDADNLSDQLTALLAPIASAVGERKYILGDRPSLADAAVFGQLYMLEIGSPGWLSQHMPSLVNWYARVRDAKTQ